MRWLVGFYRRGFPGTACHDLKEKDFPKLAVPMDVPLLASCLLSSPLLTTCFRGRESPAGLSDSDVRQSRCNRQLSGNRGNLNTQQPRPLCGRLSQAALGRGENLPRQRRRALGHFSILPQGLTTWRPAVVIGLTV